MKLLTNFLNSTLLTQKKYFFFFFFLDFHGALFVFLLCKGTQKWQPLLWHTWSSINRSPISLPTLHYDQSTDFWPWSLSSVMKLVNEQVPHWVVHNGWIKLITLLNYIFSWLRFDGPHFFSSIFHSCFSSELKLSPYTFPKCFSEGG